MTLEVTRPSVAAARAAGATARAASGGGGGGGAASMPPSLRGAGAPNRLTSARNAYDPLLALATLVTIWAAALPLLYVLAPGPWLLGCAALTIAILATGLMLRRLRQRALVVVLGTTAIFILLMTGLFASEEAVFAIIPTPAVLAAIPSKVDAAMELIIQGSAPLAVTPELAFVLFAGIGVLTVVLDAVVLGGRWVMLGVPALIAVFIIPSLAVPRDVEASQFVVFAACLALLLRSEVRGRERLVDGLVRRSPGVTMSATAVTAAALIATVVIAPTLPSVVRPAPAPLSVFSNRINPTLALGNDLRSPTSVQVLSVSTSAPAAPYLRVVTLSEFNGSVWVPDSAKGEPLGADAKLPVPTVAGDVRVIDYESNIEVVNLASPWLPVPFPTVTIEGLQGNWLAADNNQTVFSRTTTTAGQKYRAIATVARPTLEQARAAAVTSRANTGSAQAYTALPPDMPSIVRETALEVTSEATTDYDRLIAMQRWFRGPDFRYSLEAPVAAGFDGSGVDAVAAFLEVRRGYCVHFASAFALMARTLGIPTRIVVGYLPGVSTPERVNGQTVFTVSSTQLHAWPEVLFPDIGWVPFEPTNSLGTPTNFTAASVTGPGNGNGEAGDPNASDPSASPTTTPSLAPDDAAQRGGGSAARTVDPTPWLVALLLVLVALASPGVLRELRRRGRLAATHSGDAVAAWREVLDDAVDLGIHFSPGESPRVFARRMISTHGAPEEELMLLVSAIEDASYAPGSAAWNFANGPALADAVTRVRSGMLRTAGTTPRLLSVVAPRSLIVRATSAFASTEDSTSRATR